MYYSCQISPYDHRQKKIRFFFSSFLKLLPGVHRKLHPSFQQPEQAEIKEQKTIKLFKEFDK